MLKEVKMVAQLSEEPIRRHFRGKDLELTVWFESAEAPIGFQISYKNGSEQKAITWLPSRGYMHNTVDEGDNVAGTYKMIDILVPDGVFQKDRVLDQFLREGSELESAVFQFVRRKIEDHQQQA